MAYKYECDVIDELEQMGADYQSNGYFNMSIEVEEVYRKAKAFDEICKYVKRKLSAEVPLDDDYLIGRFESYETIQEFIERADDDH